MGPTERFYGQKYY